MWPWGVGQVGGGCLGWSTIVYMSSGIFRGKESSNRIELSRLVQELLNFGVFGFLQLLGVGGGWGVPTCAHTCTCTHTCMHTHACTCMHGKHGNFMQMAAPIGEIPGNSLWCHMHVHVCAHVCVCAHGWGAPPHHPPPPFTHPPPPHPQGGTPRIIQNSIALELIEIFQFCLKI